MIYTTNRKVLLAERNEVVSPALRSVVGSIAGLDVAWNVREIQAVFRLIEQVQPDLILLSHSLLPSQFVVTIRAITRQSPNSKVLLLSSDNNSRFALRAIEAGASGYMLEDRAFEELALAIDTVMSGRTYLSPGIAGVEPPPNVSSRLKGRAAESDLSLKKGVRSNDQPARILVVDDEESIRKMLRSTFESAGYSVETAATTSEAIAVLGREPPNIAFVDLVMPGGSGVQVVQAIREIDEFLPVVILTGYPDSELMHQAMAYSPFLVLAKPASSKTLLDTTRGVLAGRARLSLGASEPE